MAVRIEAQLAHWVALPSVTGQKQEAATRIKQAFDEKLTKLDLSCLRLNEIPPFVGLLTHLRALDLLGNNLERLPDEIGQLTQLEVLGLNYNRRLEHLPQSLGKIPSLTYLLTGSTAISDKRHDEIITSSRATALQDQMRQQKVMKDALLYSKRPDKVQEAIDEVHSQLMRKGGGWRFAGTLGLYSLLSFNEEDVIAQRIERASPNKTDLYFIDLGSGYFGWVDAASAFLHRKYAGDHRRFHVIGVTGEGEPFDSVQVDGNVTTHKISGFKLENLLEAFPQFHLQLENSVEFIATRWTLCHLVDPLGTLEQAYHLLSCGNGMIFGTGFHPYGVRSNCPDRDFLGHTLSCAFGTDNYIARRNTEGDPDQFALFRSDSGRFSYAKTRFAYHPEHPLIDLGSISNCFAGRVAHISLSHGYGNACYTIGGKFYGFGTYVLEQLLGNEGKTFTTGDRRFKDMPLFLENCPMYTKYLDSTETFKVQLLS